MNAVTIWAIEQSITGGVKTGEESKDKGNEDIKVADAKGGKWGPYKSTNQRQIYDKNPNSKILPKGYKNDIPYGTPGKETPISPSTPKWIRFLNSFFEWISNKPFFIIVPNTNTLDPEYPQCPNCTYDENGDIIT